MAEEYIQRLKEISVVQILQDIYNIECQKRGERYCCKIRPERTESCYIYPENTWYDFGAGVGGDSINLIQTMESCDRKSAMQKLSDYYGISPSHKQRNGNALWDNEWFFLGIYPDMVSKNLNIFVVGEDKAISQKADINLDPSNADQIRRFEKKYHVPMNEFRKTDPVGYHSVLKKRALIPLLTEKEDYFSHLLSMYRLLKQIGDSDFAKASVANDQEFIQQSENLNKRCELLRRAVDDISLLKVPLLNLSPKQDLSDILLGKTEVRLSKVGYYQLCLLAREHKSRLSVATLSYDDYIEKYSDDSELHMIPHSTVYKNGACTMHFFKNCSAEISKIFNDCDMKVTDISDTFGLTFEKNKAKSTSNSPFKIPE